MAVIWPWSMKRITNYSKRKTIRSHDTRVSTEFRRDVIPPEFFSSLHTSDLPSELTLYSADFHGIRKEEFRRIPRNSAVFYSEFLCLPRAGHQKLTLEPLRLTLGSSSSPRAVEEHPGAMKAHTAADDAHPVAVAAHNEAIEIHPGAVKAHLGAFVAHPTAMET
jgi:hypothetical protein